MTTAPDSAGTPRVAIFHADWPLQCHTTNVAIVLASHGYEVDLFLHRATGYVDLDTLRSWKTVNVHDLTKTPAPGPRAVRDSSGKQWLKDRFPGLVRRASSFRLRAYAAAAGVLADGLVADTLALMEGKSYRCFIGVEKRGVVWAGTLAARTGTPLFYYSLELYTDAYLRFKKEMSVSVRRLRRAERRAHRMAAATIIQDAERERVLFEDNRVSPVHTRVFHVPVSLIGAPHRGRSRFLHERLGLPETKRIILSFGHIWRDRYALEMTRAAQTFPDDWVLVMHGSGPPAVLDEIRSLDAGGKVVLSLDAIPFSQISELVASADVGLSFYSPFVSNDVLSAFSSEKMAWYMRCGVPFVAFDYPGYQQLARNERAGCAIGSMDQLHHAVLTILADHERYRENAFAAFTRYYDFTKNFAPVVGAIDRL